MKKIETERLLLREWLAEDLAPFAKINQDPKVLECLLKPLSDEETANLVKDFQKHFQAHGYGFYACVPKETGICVGFVGLRVVPFKTHFTPAVEIGWRLASDAWGKGYATEAAKAVLTHAFEKLHLQEIVAFTVPKNFRSIRVMEKIGMSRDLEGDFEHPLVPFGHPLRHHILYRIHNEQSQKA